MIKKLSIILMIVVILCITVFLSVKHKKQSIAKQEEDFVWDIYLEVMSRDVDSGNIK